MKDDEVVLRAEHVIDLGYHYIADDDFVLNSIAKETLARKYTNFVLSYGTHFISGV